MEESFYSLIRKKLRQKGVRNDALFHELYDHYCCLYEASMSNELLDHNAVRTEVLNAIDAQDLTAANSEITIIHHYKPILMSAFVTAFALIISLQWNTSIHLLQDPPNLWPIDASNNDIVGTMGMRIHPTLNVKKFHKGIDIKAPNGTPVHSTESGTVLEARESEKLGFFVVVKHDETYVTRYHHLSKINVSEGQKVEAGQLIGNVGGTGMSTGPHLHYEVIKNGDNVNPLEYLNARRSMN